MRTSLLDEKAAAAHCLGAIAEHGGAALHPQLEPCLTALLAQEDYFHEDVRLVRVRVRVKVRVRVRPSRTTSTRT